MAIVLSKDGKTRIDLNSKINCTLYDVKCEFKRNCSKIKGNKPLPCDNLESIAF